MSDRFEHKLREKAANFEVPFNEADWDKMNLMLEADSGKKSVSWLRRLLLLSLVANFAFLTWFGYSKLTETDQPRLAQNAEVNSQHTSPSKSNSSISKSTDLNSTSSNSSQSNFNKDSKPSELNSTSDDRSKSKTNPSLANKPNVSLKGSSLINHLRARKSASDFAEKKTSSYKNNRSRDKEMRILLPIR